MRLPRWLTPNNLTFARLAGIPVLFTAFFVPVVGGWIMLAVFVLASLTDWLDGWLARKTGQVSELGRMLDPIADKLLVTTALLVLAATGGLSAFGLLAAVTILLREVFIAGLREFAAGRMGPIHVTFLAKTKTAVQMVAISVLLLAWAMGNVPLWRGGEALLVLAAILTAWTGRGYLQAAQKEGIFR